MNVRCLTRRTSIFLVKASATTKKVRPFRGPENSRNSVYRSVNRSGHDGIGVLSWFLCVVSARVYQHQGRNEKNDDDTGTCDPWGNRAPSNSNVFM